MTVLLEVENLRTQFATERGLVKAVDGVSYHMNEGEIVGLVLSGKTATGGGPSSGTRAPFS